MKIEKAIEIKVYLIRNGITQAQIARTVGVTKQMVNQVINGRLRSRRVEEYIENLMSKAA